jgi:hypothetical protein
VIAGSMGRAPIRRLGLALGAYGRQRVHALLDGRSLGRFTIDRFEPELHFLSIDLTRATAGPPGEAGVHRLDLEVPGAVPAPADWRWNPYPVRLGIVFGSLSLDANLMVAGGGRAGGSRLRMLQPGPR